MPFSMSYQAAPPVAAKKAATPAAEPATTAPRRRAKTTARAQAEAVFEPAPAASEPSETPDTP